MSQDDCVKYMHVPNCIHKKHMNLSFDANADRHPTSHRSEEEAEAAAAPAAAEGAAAAAACGACGTPFKASSAFCGECGAKRG